MAELLDPTEIMFTAFEPKVANRFIMYIEGIPAYLIKATNRPGITFGDVVLDHINVERKLKGKGRWNDVSITLGYSVLEYTCFIKSILCSDILSVNYFKIIIFI